MGKSAGSPPNPYTTAAAQTSSNQATAATQQGYNVQDANLTAGLNRIGQTGSTGDTLSYGANGQQQESLSPYQEDIYNLEQGGANTALQGVSSGISNPNAAATVNPGQQQTSTGYGGSDGLVTQESQALTNSILQQLQPTTSQQTETLTSQLANQGLTPGTTAYNNAMLANSQSINNLELGAVSSGAAEQQQEYNQALSNAQLYNTATTQQEQNQISAGDYADQQQYTVPLSVASTMQGLAQTTANPTFQSVPQVSVQSPNVAGTDVSDLVNQNYQQQVQQAQAQNSTLGGILGTAGTAGLQLAGGYSGLAGLLGIGGSTAGAAGGAGLLDTLGLAAL